MKAPQVLAMIAAGVLLAIAAPRSNAQIPPNWDHQISGITIQDNTGFGNADTFGFTTGSDVTFLTGSILGTYDLVSVRAFALLYDPSSAVVGYETLETDPIGSATFGAQYAWKPLEVSGEMTGWVDSFHSAGSAKPGNIGPNESTGLVFELNRALLDTELTSIYGFDIAVLIGAGQSDPFGNGVQPGSVSTGRVYVVKTDEPGTPPDVPEPGAAACLGAALIAGGLWLRKRSR